MARGTAKNWFGDPIVGDAQERLAGASAEALATMSEPAGVRRVFYRPARPTPDGRTLLALSRLIPPPRVHRHRYHGVLAPNARLRPHVVALGRNAYPDTPGIQGGSAEAASDEPGDETAAHCREACTTTLTRGAARSRWARLLARIYEVFPLRCPECGSTMRILAFLTDPQPVGAILRHLELPHTPPRLSPARGPPQAAFHLDPQPAGQQEVGVDSLPADDFDQTPPSIRPSPSPSPSSTSTRPAKAER